MVKVARTGNTDKFDDLFIENHIILSKQSGDGFQVDVDQPSYSWHDIIGDITPKTTGANTPVLNTWIGGSSRAYFYTTNDLNFLLYHMSHDYAKGTDLYLHLHWGHNGTAISGQLVVTFGLTYAKGHNQANFSTEIAPVLTVSTPNITTVPRYRHRIDEIQISSSTPTATQINTNLLEPDGLFNIGMVATTIPTITGSASSNLPAFFTLDLHYQSTGIGTKQKSPDFYT
jgi:hypothetical protein